MQCTRRCQWLAVLLLLGCLVLIEQAWAYHQTLRGQWSLSTLLPMLLVLAALVCLGLFFAWPRRRQRAPKRSVPPRRARK
jgi:drug/metabolite transporter (DMT)-like permease